MWLCTNSVHHVIQHCALTIYYTQQTSNCGHSSRRRLQLLYRFHLADFHTDYPEPRASDLSNIKIDQRQPRALEDTWADREPELISPVDAVHGQKQGQKQDGLLAAGMPLLLGR